MKEKKRENHTLLVVDDDPIFLEIATHFLSKSGYQCHTATNGTATLSLFDSISFDLCIFDIFMPDIKGTELAAQIHAKSPDTPIILISGMDMNDTEELQFDFIKKPLRLQKVLQKIDTILNIEAK
jgi:DNA-binding NtrC family response regulator